MRSRGASTVEYALILVAVILLAAGSFKLLGGKVGTRSNSAGDVVASEGARGGSPGLSGGGGGGGGGKGGGGGDKPSVGGKATMGVGPGEGSDNGAGSNRDTSSEQGAGGNANTKDSGGNADVTETFTPKRWMGIGLLAAGVLAMVYVLASVRRTKKTADALGGKDPPAGGKRRSRKA